MVTKDIDKWPRYSFVIWKIKKLCLGLLHFVGYDNNNNNNNIIICNNNNNDNNNNVFIH